MKTEVTVNDKSVIKPISNLVYGVDVMKRDWLPMPNTDAVRAIMSPESLEDYKREFTGNIAIKGADGKRTFEVREWNEGIALATSGKSQWLDRQKMWI